MQATTIENRKADVVSESAKYGGIVPDSTLQLLRVVGVLKEANSRPLMALVNECATSANELQHVEIVNEINFSFSNSKQSDEVVIECNSHMTIKVMKGEAPKASEGPIAKRSDSCVFRTRYTVVPGALDQELVEQCNVNRLEQVLHGLTTCLE